MSLQAQPPRIAVWLVNLFIPAAEAEPILGDLLEEFSRLAGKSTFFAHRWYWRQAWKTIAHLGGNGLRNAPCSTCRSCNRRICTASVRFWTARQDIVGSYRHVPRVLVDPLHGLHLGA